VTLVDRYGPGNSLSSSSGPTRLWRIADPLPAAVRLGRRSVAAMDRLSREGSAELRVQQGMLWRDTEAALTELKVVLDTERVELTEVDADDVGRFLPILRPDHRPALWLPEAGSLLSGALLATYQRILAQHGAETMYGGEVASVDPDAVPVRVSLTDGRRLTADRVVLCPGPGAPALLGCLGLEVPLQPFAEQVVHLGDGGASDRYDDLPCLIDGPTETDPAVYAMPTPGVGYKIGLDDPLRALTTADVDRTPHPGLTVRISDYARRAMPRLGTSLVDELVCSWTDSPDGWFVVDRVGGAVLACGDSGKGFKYSAAMGEVLSDLAEDAEPHPDVAAMSATRFAETSRPDAWTPTALGAG